jgi:hypothetical protein
MPNLADQDFQRIHADHQLEILDRSHTTIRTKHLLTLEASRTSRFYHRYYKWTGSGIEKDPIFVSGRDELGHATHRMHGPIIQNGAQRLFLVDLGREYQPGERVQLEFKQTLLDLDGKMERFLGIAVNPGCQSFTLRVLVPEEIRSRRARSSSRRQAVRHRRGKGPSPRGRRMENMAGQTNSPSATPNPRLDSATKSSGMCCSGRAWSRKLNHGKRVRDKMTEEG